MHPIRQATILTAALAALTTATGCTASDSNPLPVTPTSHSGVTITVTSPSETADIPRPDQVTPEAAKLLCDMLSSKIGSWRDQATTAAVADFNLVVHDWAGRSGGLNTQVIEDRAVVDRITSRSCPDTRRQALETLKVDKLADALVGFGG